MHSPLQPEAPRPDPPPGPRPPLGGGHLPRRRDLCCPLDASNPEEAWPLRSEPDASDIRWVRMSEVKMGFGDVWVAPRVYDDWGYMDGTEQLGA
ncbi:hypothetical protein IMZ48_15410 [Candidatus Bathyarchaeota archaeon]|nr:hypothetical protein [Candidatus Bathyarchaeota archaeon]